jgi:Chromo (CHRromatin Organisation MOdifier) domain
MKLVWRHTHPTLPLSQWIRRCSYNTKWEGPFKVVSFLLSEYTLLNLITKKTRTVHASRLKLFVFDPAMHDPMDTARNSSRLHCRDYTEFFVESILPHTGNPRKVSTLLFHVKWLNYPSSANTWEPWANLRSCEPLHVYLRANAMQRLVPRTHRVETDS